MPGLDLGLHVGARGARDMRALARVGPRRGMNALLDRRLHQRVIGGMKAHQIDAPPVAVVGVELGRVLVGERAKLQSIRPIPPGRRTPRALFAAQAAPSRRTGFLQRRIGIVEIEVGELDRLVEHLVGDGAVRVEGALRKLLVGGAADVMAAPRRAEGVPWESLRGGFSTLRRSLRRAVERASSCCRRDDCRDGVSAPDYVACFGMSSACSVCTAT